ncbi:MAG: hypothetical protein GVY05_02115 [Bacteroidetes bacterium]|jgi:methionyl-tRNA formyltransferase|nr:hypothetical protein [Bacteroidota bacterium]
MRYAFAGDRKISCRLLKFLISKGYKPLALLVSEGTNASHNQELIEIAQLERNYVLSANAFKTSENIKLLKSLDLDYVFGVHFPYIIPQEVLMIPKVGFLNLHPAYLPYNKGWHTPSWAIIDKTPFGATLHFMTENLDEGAIIHQKRLVVLPEDTANTLYQRVLNLEEEVFVEAFDELVTLNPKSKKQIEAGSSHIKKDLRNQQLIDLASKINPMDLIDKLRALTTNKTTEAAYFIKDNKRIGVQVRLFDLDDE